MKTFRISFAIVILAIIFSGCNEEGDFLASEKGLATGDYSFLDGSGSEGESTPDGQTNTQAGLITAAEWNDLNNWGLWDTLITNSFKKMPEYWNYYTNNRISVLVKDESSKPVCNAKVELKNNQTVVWSARTDNLGIAELWIGLNQKSEQPGLANYSIWISNEQKVSQIKLFADGINEITITGQTVAQKAEIAFIVDATGSMSDELEFLKKDLLDVIERVEKDNSSLNIFTGAVFYRDEGDDYVTRKNGFNDKTSKTIDFIKNQRADGGGDFPEAVHTALDVAFNELQWSNDVKTRIAFLLLDAPPHYSNEIIASIHESVKIAAKKGIKIIPITASGIDKETEFLMRFMAISTNGTYVFITDDSGIGHQHLQASVGEYHVEYLNNLLVRLIKKYTE